MTDRAQRAEEARRKILETGDPELIRRLYLLEAAAPPQGSVPPQQGQPPSAAPGSGGPGLLGLGMAVAGGAWLGTVLGGLTLSPAMSAAFADVAADLGVDMDGVDLASLGCEDVGTEGAGDFGDGAFGDLGDFFDL